MKENLVLIPILRFSYSIERGLILEQITRPHVHYEWEQYCARLLVNQRKAEELRVHTAHLLDCDTSVKVQFLCSFAALCALSASINDADGYIWWPLTEGADSFGYYSDNPAWLIPNPRTPLLFYRYGDAFGKRCIDAWFDHWERQSLIGELPERMDWPKTDPDRIDIPEISRKMVPNLADVREEGYTYQLRGKHT
jgi:hypothetical protein